MIGADLVAEVSSNHSADLDRALAFVDTAATLGFATVKFQQFRIRELFAPLALRANPALIEREAWELPESFIRELARRTRRRGIEFASTPFYLSAVEELEPWVDSFKIASYQLLWTDLLRAVGRTGKRVTLSTGMATEEEVAEAIGVLRGEGSGELTLLHCVSSYPMDPRDANLSRIAALRERFALPVGWSDHSTSVAVVRRAVRRFGAPTVELHLDLDGEGAEFSGGHCWLPGGVLDLTAALGDDAPEAEESPLDGDGSLGPRACEAHERRWRTDPADGLRPTLEERERLARYTPGPLDPAANDTYAAHE